MKRILNVFIIVFSPNNGLFQFMKMVGKNVKNNKRPVARQFKTYELLFIILKGRKTVTNENKTKTKNW